jgi:hypothetical protein
MMGLRSEKKVLLAVCKLELEPRLLAAARGLCQRLDAGLEILVCAGSKTLPTGLADLMQSLHAEGITSTITWLHTLRRRDIVKYANSHACITTVVIDSLQAWESLATDKGSNPWRQLACPLVTAAPSALQSSP